MFYDFNASPPSIVVLARHSLFVHQYASPLPPLRNFLQTKVTRTIFVRCRTSERSTVWTHVSCHATTGIRFATGVMIPFILQLIDLLVHGLDLLFLHINCVNRDRQACRKFSKWASICYRLSRGGGNVIEVSFEQIKHLI